MSYQVLGTLVLVTLAWHETAALQMKQFDPVTIDSDTWTPMDSVVGVRYRIIAI